MGQLPPPCRLQARFRTPRCCDIQDALGLGACPSPPKRSRLDQAEILRPCETRDWWFFGDTVDARGSPLRVRLFHAASVRIVRHVKVRSGLNPYDPSWTPYLSRRYA